MTTAEPLTAAIFLNPETWANPYPVYAQLRDRSPVRGQGISEPLWVLLSADQVYGAVRDHALFSSAIGLPNDQPLLNTDPPRHTRLRGLVNKVFTPRRVAEARPWIQQLVDEQLGALGDGPADVVAGYTIPLPIRVIARLLGVPGEHYRAFKRWSDAFLAVFTMDPAERAQAQAELWAYFREQAADRRQHGGDDLVAALVAAEIDGDRLTEADLLGFCQLLLIAGNETTTNLLGNALNLLTDRPDLWARLQEDRSLVEPFIDEVLRLESPVQFLLRRTTRPVELAGVDLPAGALVRVYFGAANRDPAAFPDPDAFRLDRELHQHVAFGHGLHYCLGAPLARLEAELTLTSLLDRYRGVVRGPAPAVRQRRTGVVYGFESLSVQFIRA